MHQVHPNAVNLKLFQHNAVTLGVIPAQAGDKRRLRSSLLIPLSKMSRFCDGFPLIFYK
jgi:hypothetical protein